MSEYFEIIGNTEGTEATVVVDSIGKVFAQRTTLSDRVRRVKKSAGSSLHALKDVTFAAYSGESIGILGHNGSGKSTLLKIIAGSMSPSSGEVYVKSKPVMLSISAALQPHLTGVQNIRLGLLAMGLSPVEVSQKLLEIIQFTELGDDINRPMGTYSAGMAARLRFGIATTVAPDILIVDEALSAGDATFSSKATQRMKKVIQEAGTVFIVSHSPKTILDNCNRAIWLHEGEIIADGAPQRVSSLYRNWTKLRAADKYSESDRQIERQKAKIPQISILPVA